MSITCDGGSFNINSLKLLGCNLDINDASFRTSFPHRITKENMYAILDPCHMLKLTRNTLGGKGSIELSYCIVKWDYIIKLNVLQEKEGLKFTNFLSGTHINFQTKKNECRVSRSDIKLQSC